MFGLAGSQPQKGQGKEPQEQIDYIKGKYLVVYFYLEKIVVRDRGLRHELPQ